MTRIGFTGVGRMGLPMCANLIPAGYQVTAGDARGERESAVTGCGAQWKGTAAEVAAEADVLITVLPGPDEVRDVMAGRGGDPAVLPIDMTSSSPEVGGVLFHAADDRGIGVLEAPAGGGVPAARAGKLQLSWAATLPWSNVTARCLRCCQPQRITHVGGHGAGYLAKLLVNLLWFGQAIATAEALLLARHAGIASTSCARH